MTEDPEGTIERAEDPEGAIERAEDPERTIERAEDPEGTMKRAEGPVDTDGMWEGWDSQFVTSWWVEGFTEGADAEYDEQILPMAVEHLAGARSVLDVGCGEGQVSRVAASVPGVERTVAVDVTWAQLAVGRQRGGDVEYTQAAATALPFPAQVFDTVIACLVFEHIDDLDAAIAEVGRVLAPGGRFLFFLNHPLLQTPGSGWIDDRILEEQYWRIGPYLTEDRTVEQVDKGVWIPFVHRPLSRYVNAMVAAGLLITAMLEPVPPPGFLERAHEYAEAATIPRLLFLRAEKGP